MSNTLSKIEVKKEIANCITHGFGLLFSLVAVPILISIAVSTGSVKTIVAAGVYSFCFMMVFASSTIYHSVTHPVAKKAMQIVDHIAIYFLIAGSYTPFILIFMYNPFGFRILFVLWILTFFGIFYKAFFIGRFEILSIVIYLTMGWMVIFVVKPFIAVMPSTSLSLMLIGGIIYTIGVIFFVWKKYTYHHSIWHLFVLAGAICHFTAVLYSVKA